MLQVRWGTPACAPPTARGGCAAPGTSGPASVSRCCGRGRSARGSAGRATPAWNCSSAAPAAPDSTAGGSRTPPSRPRPPLCCSPRHLAPNSRRPPPPPPSGQRQRTRDSTCARRSEHEKENFSIKDPVQRNRSSN